MMCRDWRVVAEELANMKDSDRVNELTKELLAAFEEEDRKKAQKVKVEAA